MLERAAGQPFGASSAHGFFSQASVGVATEMP